MAAHVLTYFLVVHVFAKGHFNIHKKKEIRDKFGPFMRKDIDNWGWLKTLPFYITFWPRFLLAVMNVILNTTWISIMMIGQDTSKPISGLRRKLIVPIGQF